MARRYGPARGRMNHRGRPEQQPREAMLNLRHLDSFKYYLRQILNESSINEDFTNAFIANLITKGSRDSLKEAKNYVRSLARDGVFTDRTSDDICDLLDRNRKYR